eukprot:TRINITY_DN4364_c0_g1_i13.p1 TRINITY_DN4364_c0_g1~~TRINITY_DN4364_c0_g1_i13.p1  ORF type:complete len:106 (+),score=9.64 TRINITY_DN4364_c0_g1_i13:149-466(+)
MCDHFREDYLRLGGNGERFKSNVHNGLVPRGLVGCGEPQCGRVCCDTDPAFILAFIHALSQGLSGLFRKTAADFGTALPVTPGPLSTHLPLTCPLPVCRRLLQTP